MSPHTTKIIKDGEQGRGVTKAKIKLVAKGQGLNIPYLRILLHN